MNMKRIAVAGLAVSVSLSSGIMTHAFNTSPSTSIVQPEASLEASAQSLLRNISRGAVTPKSAVSKIDQYLVRINGHLDNGAENEAALLDLKGQLLDARVELLHPEDGTERSTRLVDVTLTDEEVAENGVERASDDDGYYLDTNSGEAFGSGGAIGSGSGSGDAVSYGSSTSGTTGGGGGGGGGAGGGGGGLGALIATAAVIAVVANDSDNDGIVLGPEASAVAP